MKRALSAAMLVVTLATGAMAVPAPETLSDPAQEARALALGRQLRCLVCQGQSIDDSNADLARDLRILIRQHIRAGESDDQIKAYLTDRYGDFILMQPPFKADTYFLWLTPALVLVLGGGVVAWVVAKARRRGENLS